MHFHSNDIIEYQPTTMPKLPQSQSLPKKRSAPAPLQQDSDNQSYDQENELTRVKIGRIPYGWYDEFKHFGYDNQLKPVNKQKSEGKIEEFIRKSQNKDWWRIIRDELNARDITLTDEQLNLIDRIRSGKMASKTIATTEYKVEHEYTDPFPVHAHPPSKRNFMPSKWQQIKINKILDGLLTGRIAWNPPPQKNPDQELFDAWQSGSIAERGVINIAPMKMKLPGHQESYNPPKEYLLTEEQRREWQEMDQEDRPNNFVPASFGKMRHIPYYDRLIQERFQRCLDLYLCPRVKKRKLNIDPDILLPNLPSPSLMKPFPTSLNILYSKHSSPVKSLGVCPSGAYFISGDSSGLVIVWQILSSRAVWSWKFQEQIGAVDWARGGLIAIAHGEFVQIAVWNKPKQESLKGQAVIQEGKAKFEEILGKKKQQIHQKQAAWSYYEDQTQQYKAGLRIRITLAHAVTYLEFQKFKSDYLLTLAPLHPLKNRCLAIHRISHASTQSNIIKGGGKFQQVSFLPKKTEMVVLSERNVIAFDLMEMIVKKKGKGGGNQMQVMAVHGQGAHVVVGTSNCKILLYDLTSSELPLKTMTFPHSIISLDFHKQYPLLLSSTSEGAIHVFHFKSGSETLQDAIIVPLKVLRQGARSKGKWHHKQPWCFGFGEDGKIALWT